MCSVWKEICTLQEYVNSPILIEIKPDRSKIMASTSDVNAETDNVDELNMTVVPGGYYAIREIECPDGFVLCKVRECKSGSSSGVQFKKIDSFSYDEMVYEETKHVERIDPCRVISQLISVKKVDNIIIVESEHKYWSKTISVKPVTVLCTQF